jgi:glycosyltransferase involved in cell wall biosynthesis
VVVSVGDSFDRTAELAALHGATVVTGSRGRSQQMNDGAARAQGDVLIFLHADTTVPADAVAIATRTLGKVWNAPSREAP